MRTNNQHFDKHLHFISLIKSHPQTLPSKTILFTLVLFALISGIFELTLPFLAEFSIDKIIVSKQLHNLFNFFGIASLIYGAWWLTGFLYSLVTFKISLLLPKKIRLLIYGKLLNTFNLKSEQKISDYILSMEADCNIIVSTVLKGIDCSIKSIIIIPVCLILIMSKSQPIFFITVLLIVFRTLWITYISKHAALKFSSLRKSNTLIREFIFDSLHKIKTIHLFNTGDFFLNKLLNLEDKRLQTSKSLFWINKGDWLFNNGIASLAKILLAYLIMKELVSGRITSGESVFLGILMMKLQSSLIQTLSFFKDLRSLNEAALRLKDILDKEPVFANGKVTLREFNNLSVKNITFSYQQNKPIYKDLSFNIKKGEKIIIFGKSGSGKTTLFNLIIGLLKPQSGAIYINDQNLKNINICGWQQDISIIPQENAIFQMSASDNIELGRTDLKQNLNPVTQLSMIKPFFDAQNQNDISNGITQNLSFGELRRIIIARGLLNNKKLIIMDEPDANLGDDLATEIVKEMFQDKTKTIILFSHRRSLLELASRIIHI